MTKDEIISLAEFIAKVSLDADTLDKYFYDILDEIGQVNSPPLVAAELFEITSGTATYTLPSDAIRALDIFIGDSHLSEVSAAALRAYSASWRALSDTPYFFTQEQVGKDEFMLIPNPDTSSGNFDFPNAAPMGEDFPSGAGTIFYSQSREEDIIEWIAVYIALKILVREFARPSNHQDLAFSEACDQAAQLFWRIGGLND